MCVCVFVCLFVCLVGWLVSAFKFVSFSWGVTTCRRHLGTTCFILVFGVCGWSPSTDQSFIQRGERVFLEGLFQFQLDFLYTPAWMWVWVMEVSHVVNARRSGVDTHIKLYLCHMHGDIVNVPDPGRACEGVGCIVCRTHCRITAHAGDTGSGS